MPNRGRAPSTLSVVVALGTVYVVWGSTYLAIAYVVETLPPLLAASARFLFTSPCHVYSTLAGIFATDIKGWATWSSN